MIEINEALATKVLQTVDVGLSCGLGNPEPGQMCIEAAVNYAMGLPHGDNPSCVGGAVRAFKIALNDAPWSSKEARAKGLRKIAIAQLGSNTIDQIEFARRMAIRNAQVVLPVLFRKLEMEEAAKKLEAADDLDKVIDAAKYAAESAAKYAAEYAAEYAAKYAKYAAESAAKYAAKYAKYAAESAAKYAKYAAESAAESAEYTAKSAKSAEYTAKSAKYAAESAAKYAAKYAKYAAESAAEYAERDPDFYFKLSADVCLQVLIDMKSPGCEFLFLTEA